MFYSSGFIVTPTKVRNFLECPRKYYFYHVNPETKRLFPEKHYFTLGHHVHNTLRDFFLISPDGRTPEKLLELLEAHWQTHTGAEAGFKVPEQEAEAKDRAVTMLKRFLETENWRGKPHYLPEKEGDFPGYQQAPIESGLLFGGIVDRIDEEPDGALHIIDYKTGKGDEPDEWQLPMYAVMVGRLHNRAVGRTSYIMLEYGKRYTQEISIQGNLETIRKVKEVIARIPKSKLMQDFVCRLGDACSHCNYLLELGFDPKTGKKKGATTQQEIFSNDLPF